MPIEFQCSQCQNAIRTPDGTAGKKGKCPKCGTVQVIPAASPAVAKPATFEFPCPHCQKSVKTPAHAAGKKGKCPNCQQVFSIPDLTVALKPISSSSTAQAAAIEFACQFCATTVRVPASAAGKKGKCPSCQQIMVIPLTSTASPSSGSQSPGGLTPLNAPTDDEDLGLTELPEVDDHKFNDLLGELSGPTSSASGPTAQPTDAEASSRPQASSPSRPQPANQADKLPVAGPSQSIPVAGKAQAVTPVKSSGESTAQSTEQSTVQPKQAVQPQPKQAGRPRVENPAPRVENPAPRVNAAPGEAESRSAQSVPDTPASQGAIDFRCSHCQGVVNTPASTAGKKGKCPHCGQLVLIPLSSEQASAAAEPNRGASTHSVGQSSAANPAANSPLSGLTPLESPSGIQPSGGLQPLDSGLQPLSPGLQPLSGSAGGGLTPLEDDGLGSLASLEASAPGLTAPDLNPYAAPGLAPAARPSAQPKVGRRGLPWDREASLGNLFKTVGKVLFSPHEAFKMMKVKGGMGAPLGFIVSGFLLTGLVSGLLMMGLTLIQLLLNMTDVPAAGMVGVLIGQVIGLAMGLGFGCVVLILMTFVFAGIYHLCILIVGGGDVTYEATYRGWCYASGSVMIGCIVFNLIPLVGPLFQLVASIVYLAFAFRDAHRISGLKASMAALLPAIMCMGAMGLALFFAFAQLKAMGLY